MIILLSLLDMEYSNRLNLFLDEYLKMYFLKYAACSLIGITADGIQKCLSLLLKLLICER